MNFQKKNRFFLVVICSVKFANFNDMICKILFDQFPDIFFKTWGGGSLFW